MIRRHPVAGLAMGACLAIASLTGCATSQHDEVTFVAPGLPFRMPSPGDLGYSVRVAQLIVARYGGETYVFEAELSTAPDALTLVCLDSFGRRALTITSQGDRITTDAAPWLPSAIRAQNILADIALIYWPLDAVRRGFEGTSASIMGEGRRRIITVDEREIISIEYGPADGQRWPSSAIYRNKGFGYELTLRSAVVSQ
jgi:hypothetical protein